MVIKTKGDIMQDISLIQIGGKGVFVKEIEEALLAGTIDLAVHSMKDMPSLLPEGLIVGAVPQREDPRDVLISRDRVKLEGLPHGARIGTSSLRRGVQLRELLPDVEIVPLRGNLDTRIRKIEKDGLQGIVVAAAGLKRLGWAEQAAQFLPVELMLPAVGQGALGIEICDREDVKETVAFLNDPKTQDEVTAERAFLRELGGSCQFPVAGYALCKDDIILLRVMVGSVDGGVIIRDALSGPRKEAEDLGKRLAERILARGKIWETGI